MATITENDILKVKNEALAIRDQVISAKSTLENVTTNIKNYEEELRQLDVDPDKIDEKIAEMSAQRDEIYTSSLQTINDWKSKMV
ncbi:MAG: hypothetical protein K0R00_228 [Herbinix sp.]|jgi:predicted RNA methylase|nr:hypothetical protein [Herbinix sp.]